MDSPLTPFSFSPPPIVVLAISDPELLAMMALMLEMAGFRVMPVADLDGFEVSAREMLLRAVIVDARGSDEPAWIKVRQLQSASAARGTQVIVITASPDGVPTDLLDRGAQLLTWPFPLTDLFLVLDDR